VGVWHVGVTDNVGMHYHPRRVATLL